MDKIGKIYRSTIEKEFKDKLTDINSLFLVKFAGLKASELTELRNNLSQIKGKFFVTKNSLAQRTLDEMQLKELINFLEGQTAFIFGYDDPISICKTISKFSKEHAALEFQGGILEKRLVNKSDFATLASLPSKDELRAKFVLCIKSPLNNLMFIFSGMLKKLIYVLSAVKEKKEGTEKK